MKVPSSWLKDYVDVTIPIEELAQRLTVVWMAVKHIEVQLPQAYGFTTRA